MSIGGYLNDLFDFVYKSIEIDHRNLIINPVCLALMESLDNLMKLFILSFAIVLDKLNQIAVLKISTNPIFLLAVFQNAVTFKDIVFELSDIEVPIFEHLLAHAIELSVDIIASLD